MYSRSLHTIGAAVLFGALFLVVSERALSAPATTAEAAPTLEKLAQVVVTATKREERAVNVPISLTAVTGAELDKSSITNATQALNLVPGVSGYTAGQTNGTVLTIRGVTASGSMFSGPSPIAYYLDYVPFGLTRDAIEPNPNIYDLNRIEVLRGPQGTLYGASALNGVVNVLTNDANVNEFEVKARVGLSTTEGGGANWVGDSAINIPIVPGKLAARLVVGSQHISGWINTPLGTNVNHADSQNVRLKVTAKPLSDLTIELEAMHQGTRTGAPPDAAPNGYSASLIDQPNKGDWNAYNVHVRYTPATVFSVTSSTSYFTYYDNGAVDVAIGVPGIPPLTTRTLSRVMSEELDLLSNIQGPWRWSAGFFYRNARDSNYQTLKNLIPAPVAEADTSVSYAVFGELSRFFLDKQLEFTLGGRYFHDNVGLRQLQLFGQPPGTPLIRSQTPFKSTTPRIVLSWFPKWVPNHDEMIYASYSQGFRSGFAQQAIVSAVAPSFPPVQPDKLTNYEIGSKGRLFNGRLSLDAAVYYMKWNHIQQTIGILVPPSTAYIVVDLNGKSASGAGVDFGVTARPINALTLGLGFSWNGLHEDYPVYSSGETLFPAGSRIDSSPEYTADMTAQYSFPLGSHGWTGGFGFVGRYTSEQTTTATRTNAVVPVVAVSSVITRANVNFVVSSPDHWRWMLYCDNVGNNRRVPLRSTSTPYRDLSMQPRTFGIQLNYDFKEHE